MWYGTVFFYLHRPGGVLILLNRVSVRKVSGEMLQEEKTCMSIPSHTPHTQPYIYAYTNHIHTYTHPNYNAHSQHINTQCIPPCTYTHIHHLYMHIYSTYINIHEHPMHIHTHIYTYMYTHITPTYACTPHTYTAACPIYIWVHTPHIHISHSYTTHRPHIYM